MFYGSVIAGQAFWASLGYSGTLTEAQLTSASIYVDGMGWRRLSNGTFVSRFPGKVTDPAQLRQWPRTGATTNDGDEIGVDAVPVAVEQAAYEAAYYENRNPGALNPSVRGDQVVTSERFGPVSFTYGNPESSSYGVAPALPVIPSVLTLLAPVLVGGTNPYGITGVVA